jgi:dihydroneopterin aldolase
VLTVFVKGLEFYAYHGVPAEERTIGHRYSMDLTLSVEATADVTDEVEDTVDYATAATFAQEIAQATQYRTVEKLAGVVADRLLDRYPLVHSVTVQVAKRLPPAPIIAEAVGVVLTKGRRV